ncbi:hypothetical protein GGF31_004565 [Allomyces arbusculus]|nr:hypothetical protein GGF31_004565 [Allomyces arbusculus]
MSTRKRSSARMAAAAAAASISETIAATKRPRLAAAAANPSSLAASSTTSSTTPAPDPAPSTTRVTRQGRAVRALAKLAASTSTGAVDAESLLTDAPAAAGTADAAEGRPGPGPAAGAATSAAAESGDATESQQLQLQASETGPTTPATATAEPVSAASAPRRTGPSAKKRGSSRRAPVAGFTARELEAEVPTVDYLATLNWTEFVASKPPPGTLRSYHAHDFAAYAHPVSSVRDADPHLRAPIHKPLSLQLEDRPRRGSLSVFAGRAVVAYDDDARLPTPHSDSGFDAPPNDLQQHDSMRFLDDHHPAVDPCSSNARHGHPASPGTVTIPLSPPSRASTASLTIDHVLSDPMSPTSYNAVTDAANQLRRLFAAQTASWARDAGGTGVDIKQTQLDSSASGTLDLAPDAQSRDDDAQTVSAVVSADYVTRPPLDMTDDGVGLDKPPSELSITVDPTADSRSSAVHSRIELGTDSLHPTIAPAALDATTDKETAGCGASKLHGGNETIMAPDDVIKTTTMIESKPDAEPAAMASPVELPPVSTTTTTKCVPFDSCSFDDLPDDELFFINPAPVIVHLVFPTPDHLDVPPSAVETTADGTSSCHSSPSSSSSESSSSSTPRASFRITSSVSNYLGGTDKIVYERVLSHSPASAGSGSSQEPEAPVVEPVHVEEHEAKLVSGKVQDAAVAPLVVDAPSLIPSSCVDQVTTGFADTLSMDEPTDVSDGEDHCPAEPMPARRVDDAVEKAMPNSLPFESARPPSRDASSRPLALPAPALPAPAPTLEAEIFALSESLGPPTTHEFGAARDDTSMVQTALPNRDAQAATDDFEDRWEHETAAHDRIPGTIYDCPAECVYHGRELCVPLFTLPIVTPLLLTLDQRVVCSAHLIGHLRHKPQCCQFILSVPRPFEARLCRDLSDTAWRHIRTVATQTLNGPKNAVPRIRRGRSPPLSPPRGPYGARGTERRRRPTSPEGPPRARSPRFRSPPGVPGAWSRRPRSPSPAAGRMYCRSPSPLGRTVRRMAPWMVTVPVALKVAAGAGPPVAFSWPTPVDLATAGLLPGTGSALLASRHPLTAATAPQMAVPPLLQPGPLVPPPVQQGVQGAPDVVTNVAGLLANLFPAGLPPEMVSYLHSVAGVPPGGPLPPPPPLPLPPTVPNAPTVSIGAALFLPPPPPPSMAWDPMLVPTLGQTGIRPAPPGPLVPKLLAPPAPRPAVSNILAAPSNLPGNAPAGPWVSTSGDASTAQREPSDEPGQQAGSDPAKRQLSGKLIPQHGEPIAPAVAAMIEACVEIQRRIEAAANGKESSSPAGPAPAPSIAPDPAPKASTDPATAPGGPNTPAAAAASMTLRTLMHLVILAALVLAGGVTWGISLTAGSRTVVANGQSIVQQVPGMLAEELADLLAAAMGVGGLARRTWRFQDLGLAPDGANNLSAPSSSSLLAWDDQVGTLATQAVHGAPQLSGMVTLVRPSSSFTGSSSTISTTSVGGWGVRLSCFPGVQTNCAPSTRLALMNATQSDMARIPFPANDGTNLHRIVFGSEADSQTVGALLDVSREGSVTAPPRSSSTTTSYSLGWSVQSYRAASGRNRITSPTADPVWSPLFYWDSGIWASYLNPLTTAANPTDFQGIGGVDVNITAVLYERLAAHAATIAARFPLPAVLSGATNVRLFLVARFPTGALPSSSSFASVASALVTPLNSAGTPFVLAMSTRPMAVPEVMDQTTDTLLAAAVTSMKGAGMTLASPALNSPTGLWLRLANVNLGAGKTGAAHAHFAPLTMGSLGLPTASLGMWRMNVTLVTVIPEAVLLAHLITTSNPWPAVTFFLVLSVLSAAVAAPILHVSTTLTYLATRFYTYATTHAFRRPVKVPTTGTSGTASTSVALLDDVVPSSPTRGSTMTLKAGDYTGLPLDHDPDAMRGKWLLEVYRVRNAMAELATAMAKAALERQLHDRAGIAVAPVHGQYHRIVDKRAAAAAGITSALPATTVILSRAVSVTPSASQVLERPPAEMGRERLDAEGK